MRIFILAITVSDGGVMTVYPGATIAEDKADALANGYAMAREDHPNGMYNVVSADITDWLNAHHVNGEVEK